MDNKLDYCLRGSEAPMKWKDKQDNTTENRNIYIYIYIYIYILYTTLRQRVAQTNHRTDCYYNSNPISAGVPWQITRRNRSEAAGARSRAFEPLKLH